MKKFCLRLFASIISAVVLAININSFVRAGNLLPGGASGLTLLIQQIFSMYFSIQVPYVVINLLLNSIPIFIGFKFIGKKFTMFSCLNIILTAILTDILPVIPITKDILLLSIFGGIMYGMAVSISLNNDTTTGGTDFISIFLSEKKGIDAYNIIFGFNSIMLIVAGALMGWDEALYSIIFQFASTTIIRITYQKYQKITMLIITEKPTEVADTIYKKCQHGATILKGEGSYEHDKRQIVYSVVAKTDSNKLVKAIKQIDENAFCNIVATERLFGRFYQKPND